MQIDMESFWQMMALGSGAMCLGIALALGVGLMALVSGAQERQQRLLSSVSVVMLAMGTLLLTFAML